jgi:hypothetical protein
MSSSEFALLQNKLRQILMFLLSPTLIVLLVKHRFLSSGLIRVPDPLTPQQLERVHLLLDQVAQRQRNDFGHIVSDVKPDGSLITACDRWSDAAFVQGLAEITPGEGVLSEEGSKSVRRARRTGWLIRWTAPPISLLGFLTGLFRLQDS